jgi:hypothetical protein
MVIGVDSGSNRARLRETDLPIGLNEFGGGQSDIVSPSDFRERSLRSSMIATVAYCGNAKPVAFLRLERAPQMDQD